MPYNSTVLLGNLTRDPEMRVLPKGTSVCQFGMAVNRKSKGADGQDYEEVLFIDVEAWGKQAETIAKYCTKGQQFMVNGRLKLDKWTDKTTQQERTKIKLVLEGFSFVGKREDGGGGGEPAREPVKKPAGGNDEDCPY